MVGAWVKRVREAIQARITAQQIDRLTAHLQRDIGAARNTYPPMAAPITSFVLAPQLLFELQDPAETPAQHRNEPGPGDLEMRRWTARPATS